MIMLYYNVLEDDVKFMLTEFQLMRKSLCLGLFFLLSAGSAWGAPRVVVSIKPIHALVAGVMRGVGEPQLLIEGGGSPHGYVLRPSEARALSQAELIIWVGPQLESFLQKPLQTLGRSARQLELAEVLKPQLLPLRENGHWDEHEEHAGEGEHGHPLAGNPHFWLDPLLAQRVAIEVATLLGALDPPQREVYQHNAERLQQRLTELHSQLQRRLAPVGEIPYLVFHDAYPYFEKAYGLRAIGSISLNPERKPGARRILQMREKIRQLQARCVFSEPQFEPRLVATIIEGTGARTGVLDPLGADLPAGEESYFLLLNRLADNLLEGLR